MVCRLFIPKNNISVIYNETTIYYEKDVYRWIQQAARGIQHLHKLNIFHRDVKPEKFSFHVTGPKQAIQHAHW